VTPSQRGESRFAIIASITANVAIAITKFAVAAIAHSTAMLAEGVHSLSNCFDGALLLLGQSRAGKPADDAHPFGYGREEYFWSMIVAIVFFALGAGVAIYEGVRHVVAPEPLRDPKWSYIVLGASALFDGSSFVLGFRQFRREAHGRGYWATVRHSKNPSLFSVVLEDTADLVGLALAFLGIYFGHALGLPWLDGAASILIGILLCLVAVVMVNESRKLLVGEGMERGTLERIRGLINEDEAVEDIGRLLTMYLGPEDVMLVVEVRFKASETIVVRDAVARIKKKIREAIPRIRRVYFDTAALDERDA